MVEAEGLGSDEDQPMEGVHLPDVPRRKRKRVEVEEEVGSDEEVESDEDQAMEGVDLPDVPRRIIWGRRSRRDGKEWICGRCQYRNLPSQHLFVNLPAFRCGKCNAQTRTNFRFCFGNLAGNGICPIGKILNQGHTDDCLIYALTKVTEMTARICTFLSGSSVIIPTLSPYSLKRIFILSRMDDGIPRDEIDFQDDAAMATMMEIMQTTGIQDKKCTHTCRIGGVEQVEGNFEDIVEVLADGYPLVVEIMPGSKFEDLLYGEIYRCPFNDKTLPKRRRKKGVTTHMVILVGAARLAEVDYFYFLNSYGQLFCLRSCPNSEDKIGGIGKLLADDICHLPYKFLRLA